MASVEERSQRAEKTNAAGAAQRPLWSRALRQLAELPLLVAAAFAIAVVVKTLLVQAFYIPSGSMLPTLRVGDRVLVEKPSYFFGKPEAKDIVVFERSAFGAPADLPWTEDVRNFLREMLGLPTGGHEDYIKRVVATGGDTIRYAGKPRRLFVNGQRIREPYVEGGADRASATLTTDDCKHLGMTKAGRGCRVPAGSVFVMGDNRANSEDSRILGPIDEDEIVGRAFVLIWPPDRLGRL